MVKKLQKSMKKVAVGILSFSVLISMVAQWSITSGSFASETTQDMINQDESYYFSSEDIDVDKVVVKLSEDNYTDIGCNPDSEVVNEARLMYNEADGVSGIVSAYLAVDDEYASRLVKRFGTDVVK